MKQHGVQARGAAAESGRKRRRWKKRLSRYGTYLLLRSLHVLVSRLPLRAGRALSWGLGSAAYYLLGRDRRTALRNLTRVYGAERPPSAIRALARGVFRSTAAVVIDWIILRRWPREKLLASFPEAVALVRKMTEDVRASGSGMVGLTAHVGNWEVLSLIASHLAPGLVVPVANRIYFKKYNDFIHRLRAGTGLEVIYTDESPRKMLRAVRDGRLLALLPDHEIRTNSGVFVDFFGLPAYTATFPVDVARRLGVKMLLILLVREGHGFRAVYREPFDVPRTDDETADILQGTQLWTRMLEEEVRKVPEQWTWMQNRWRSTPERPRRHVDRGRSVR
jgi:Kdo2-lipid IVA lauroyltransferase/acyltransferase